MSSIEQDASGRLGQVLLEKYTIERLVGTGGMATVYAARHRTGRQVAVKLLHPEMSEREDVRERFRREAYAANRVKHEGAVQIIDDDVAEDGSAFLVMELLEGESLTARANRAAIDTHQLLIWMDAILDVLAACHEENIVHRDLKPDNIFLTKDGRVKLLDFGIARVSDVVPTSFKTRMGTAIGTAPYMAPEQALGKMDEIDGRTDLFSVGATMFRLIARRRIHEVANDADLLVAMATMPAPPLASVSNETPASVCSIVDRALAFLPTRRYPDARTMQEDIRAVLRGEDPPHATALLANGVAPWVRRERTQDVVEPTVREVPIVHPVEPTAIDVASDPPATAPATSERPPSTRPSQRMAPPRPSPSVQPPAPRPSRVVAPPVVAPETGTPLAAPPSPHVEPLGTPPPSATAFPPIVGAPPGLDAPPISPGAAGPPSVPLSSPGQGPLGFTAPLPPMFLAPAETAVSGSPGSPPAQSSRPALIALGISGVILVLGLAATVAWWASGTYDASTAPVGTTEPSAQVPAPRPITTPASTNLPSVAAIPAKSPTPSPPPAAAALPSKGATPALAPLSAAAIPAKGSGPSPAQPSSATPARKPKNGKAKGKP